MKKYLIGKRISLHGLTEKDLSDDQPYFSWLDDLSLDTYTERSYFPNNSRRMRSYFDEACENDSLILLGIFDNETSKHIGNITFQEIDWINRRAFIAYMLGDKSFAGRGIVTDAVLMMMYYGFNKLNFGRIHGGVSELHGASIRICEKVGLLEEGRMRGHIVRNGDASDILIVGALREEWLGTHGEKAREMFEESPT